MISGGLASLDRLHTSPAHGTFSFSLNNVVINTVIERVEMVEILDERLDKRSVERVVCNKQFITLGHCDIRSHLTLVTAFLII